MERAAKFCGACGVGSGAAESGGPGESSEAAQARMAAESSGAAEGGSPGVESVARRRVPPPPPHPPPSPFSPSPFPQSSLPPPRPTSLESLTAWIPSQLNGFAILSLVLSLIWVGGLGSIGAVVLGHMAKRQIAASDGQQTGNSLATAGLVIGYIGIAILFIYVAYAVALASSI
jgi:hypothetical protein